LLEYKYDPKGNNKQRRMGGLSFTVRGENVFTVLELGRVQPTNGQQNLEIWSICRR